MCSEKEIEERYFQKIKDKHIMIWMYLNLIQKIIQKLKKSGVFRNILDLVQIKYKKKDLLFKN